MTSKLPLPALLEALFYLFCSPCCLWACIQDAVHGIKEERREVASWPKKLPKKRRDLSIVRYPTRRTSNKTSFLDLPFELREIIYKDILGGNLIHIRHIPWEKRLGHWHCDYSRPAHDTHTYGDTPSNIKPFINGKLALLKTCRQVYNEAIKILYRENTFAFCGSSSMDVFAAFINTTTSQRLANIKSLYINMRADVFKSTRRTINLRQRTKYQHVKLWDPQWIWQWDIIGTRMTGLRIINLKLERMHNVYFSLDEGWVKPLLGVKNIDSFSLVIYQANTSEVYRRIPLPYATQ